MRPFDKDFIPHYGKAVSLSPLIRRVVAENPSPFTFHGTGTYIIGQGNVAVIDPGPDLPAHISALEKALAGMSVSHILITHHHMDHSPAATALKELTGAEIYGFEPPAPHPDSPAEEGVDQNFKPDHLLKDTDILKGDGWTMEAVHTPGHLSNHLCFALQEEKVLFSGDHVMGWSTSIVSPPDGNMKDYLASLEKLTCREEDLYYPTHGNPIPNAREFVRGLIDHRTAREEQIIAAISEGAAAIPDMVTAIYTDIPTFMHGAAGRSVLAHLIHMEERGVIGRRNVISGQEEWHIS